MRNANYCVGLVRSRRKAAVTPQLSPKLGNLQIIKLLLTGAEMMLVVDVSDQQLVASEAFIATVSEAVIATATKKKLSSHFTSLP